MHKFKPDKISACRRGCWRKHKVPTLTNKFFIIDICTEKEKSIFSHGQTVGMVNDILGQRSEFFQW